jgi:benzoyl-CoA reductase/2-hydroxyglutaryl-CoA dehydratase subunit BcrC/BadD/HgdB
MLAKSCSLVKALLGILDSQDPVPRVGNLDLVVNPTTCDQKKRAGAMIAEMGYPVYDLELPPSKQSEAARRYWQRSVRDFTRRLRRLTGKRLKRKNLRSAMARTALAQAAFRACTICARAARRCFWARI